MRKPLFISTLVAALMSVAVSAHALILTPNQASYTGADLTPKNPTSAVNEETYIRTLFGTGDLTLYYKDDHGGGESGSFDSAYSTSYSNTSSDPSNALITYISGTAIRCPDCYLAVKDGNHDPSYYFFDLGSWNGTESLDLRNFWPGPGAISHVAIWGEPGTTRVPEPATTALLGLGLFGLAAMRRRRPG